MNFALTARSFLFLPADRLERLDKALASGAHGVILDLEDAVAPAHKEASRARLRAQWPGLPAEARSRIAVRINAASTPFHEPDVALTSELADAGLAAVMLAKAESPSDLAALHARLPAAGLLPLMESAQGLAAMDSIAGGPGVVRLVLGHLDLQLDLGMECGADERELDSIRTSFAIASRRANLPGPVDGVTVDMSDAAALERDLERGRRFGFTGKLCIHPRQVENTNARLGPTPAKVEWARRVVSAAQANPAGAFQLDGAMVDAPVLARARRYLQLAS